MFALCIALAVVAGITLGLLLGLPWLASLAEKPEPIPARERRHYREL